MYLKITTMHLSVLANSWYVCGKQSKICFTDLNTICSLDVSAFNIQILSLQLLFVSMLSFGNI